MSGHDGVCGECGGKIYRVEGVEVEVWCHYDQADNLTDPPHVIVATEVEERPTVEEQMAATARAHEAESNGA